ncbi:MAG: hypothetical protein AB1813_26625, partial [Verrucomicrobiota bacterium]
PRAIFLVLFAGFAGLACLTGSGCKDSSEAPPANPEQAATQLQQVFESAPAEMKKNADIASAAMKTGDYEKAVVSLQVIRSGDNITLDQGIAIHHSMVALEARLVNAMAAGDENARRAYQLLRDMKRN